MLARALGATMATVVRIRGGQIHSPFCGGFAHQTRVVISMVKLEEVAQELLMKILEHIILGGLLYSYEDCIPSVFVLLYFIFLGYGTGLMTLLKGKEKLTKILLFSISCK
jgi:hypothetical protein